jgi:hypothetical protein
MKTILSLSLFCTEQTISNIFIIQIQLFQNNKSIQLLRNTSMYPTHFQYLNASAYLKQGNFSTINPFTQ